MRPDISLRTVRHGDSSQIAVCLNSVANELNILLADIFALYIKTKNFHWHMSGPHFRDFHLLLDENADQLFGMTDEIAERVRKIRCTTNRSIGQIAKLQTIGDNDSDDLTPDDMLEELHADEMLLTSRMHTAHTLCDGAGDIATASLLENWIDQSQRRAWFLLESIRR
ncbi:Dps family protein [Granulicella paludicola]|uniref:Dps family protein n=1 Tax=Granulicella paludicola TaxID=474951 RepID=UPI0021DFA01F|nr:DNA starvation/stationary phase protection protein [Granulicella paludicola]